MDCICSCWAQDPAPLPPLGNSLLVDPSITANEHKWTALTYEFIHVIAIVAFMALAIGALTWAIFVAAEYQATVILASVLLFSTIYPAYFHPYRVEAQSYWRKEAFENLVKKHIQTIQTEFSTRKDLGSQYLLDLHHNIGARPLSEQIEQKIKNTTGKASAYASLIPLYARAQAYNEESAKILTRLHTLILSPPRSTDQQDLEYANYKTLLNKETDEKLSGEERISVHRQVVLRMSEWRKLEENYLSSRVNAAQVAAIASNPIQAGKPMGHINPFLDPASEALYSDYRGIPLPFFYVNGSNQYLPREGLMTTHIAALQKITLRALQKDLLNDPTLPTLSDAEWANIDEAVLNFVEKLKENKDSTDLDEILQNPIQSRELLCIPEIRNAVQTMVSHSIRSLLERATTIRE